MYTHMPTNRTRRADNGYKKNGPSEASATDQAPSCF